MPIGFRRKASTPRSPACAGNYASARAPAGRIAACAAPCSTTLPTLVCWAIQPREPETMKLRESMCTALLSASRLGALLLAVAIAPHALAQPLPKIVFLTNWYAEAEHGGFYQAVAEGIYRRHGLDVEVKMGGPQVNVVQLLVGGQADLVMGYDLQTIQ